MLGGECECRDVGPTKSGINAGNYDAILSVEKNSGGDAMTHIVAV